MFNKQVVEKKPYEQSFDEQSYENYITTFILECDLTNEKDIDFLIKQTTRYSLKLINGATLRKTTKKLNIISPLREFKVNRADYSRLILADLWRAVYNYVRTKEFPEKEKFNVSKGDIKFCLSYLTEVDIKELQKKSKADYEESPNYEQLYKQILIPTFPYIYYKTKKKLTFITLNDQAIKQEDFIEDLKVKAFRTLLENSHVKNLIFIKKAIIKKVNDEIVNLITKHTYQKREKVYQISEAEIKKELVKITDKDNKISFEVSKRIVKEATYGTMSVSLDKKIPHQNSESLPEINLHHYIPDNQKDTETCTSDNEISCKVIEMAKEDKKLQIFLEVILNSENNLPEKFTRWLKKEHNLSSERESKLKYREIARLAREYSGLDNKELKEKLKPILINLNILKTSYF